MALCACYLVEAKPHHSRRIITPVAGPIRAGGIRTRDNPIKSRGLCPLSYSAFTSERLERSTRGLEVPCSSIELRRVKRLLAARPAKSYIGSHVSLGHEVHKQHSPIAGQPRLASRCAARASTSATENLTESAA